VPAGPVRPCAACRCWRGNAPFGDGDAGRQQVPSTEPFPRTFHFSVAVTFPVHVPEAPRGLGEDLRLDSCRSARWSARWSRSSILPSTALMVRSSLPLSSPLDNDSIFRCSRGPFPCDGCSESRDVLTPDAVVGLASSGDGGGWTGLRLTFVTLHIMALRLRRPRTGATPGPPVVVVIPDRIQAYTRSFARFIVLWFAGRFSADVMNADSQRRSRICR